MANIRVNDKELTEEEFRTLQESISSSKSMQLIETAPDTYKTRLLG